MSDDAQIELAQKRITEVREKIARLDDAALDLLYREARSHNWFTDQPVSDDQLREIYDLVKFGSTSSNTQPMRVVFIKSAEAKERLKPAMIPANVDKTMIAPATAIIGYDNSFWKDFAKNYPIRPEMAERFKGDENVAEKFAYQQATLQGAYFIMAVRAVGLDAGGMGGFDNAKVDEEFFAGTTVKSNFLVNIGYGDLSGIKGGRLHRYEFDEVCSII
jgi:3-hydroxypropanoate dehydrogenase